MVKLKASFANIPNWQKLLFLLCFTLFVSIFVMSLAMIVTGMDATTSTNTNALRLLQAIQGIVVFIIPPIVLAYFCSDNTSRYLFLHKKIPAIYILYLFVFIVLALPGINLLAELNHNLVLPESMKAVEDWMKASEKAATDLTEQFLSVNTISFLFINIFVMAVVPALGEELMFRSSLLRIFNSEKSKHLAVWASAIVFSAIHMQFYGFVPRMLLGACFGYMVVWSGSIYPAIWAHFFNNALLVIAFYVRHNGYTVFDIDNVGIGSTWWLGVISIFVSIAGMLFFYKISRFEDK